MLMKGQGIMKISELKWVWVVINSESGYEPWVYALKEKAVSDALEFLKDTAKHWGFSETDEDYVRAVNELREGDMSGWDSFGTYLIDLDIHIYKKEIEF